MPIYTFYPCRSDGSSTTFEALELGSDDDARERATVLLEQHPSCAFVTVWRGDREILPAHETTPVRTSNTGARSELGRARPFGSPDPTPPRL